MLKLLPSQEADLGLIIAQSGLARNDFELTSVDGGFAGYVSPHDTPGVIHRPSGGWFGIARHMESQGITSAPRNVGFLIAFMPGAEKRVEEHGRLEWRSVLDQCRTWLKYLAREVQAPSFAAVLESAGAEETAKAEQPFTPIEAESISHALQDLQGTLQDLGQVQAQHHDYVVQEFAALREELTKMRRGRWRKMAMGTIVNMATNSVIPPDAASRIWARIEQVIASASSLLPPAGA